MKDDKNRIFENPMPLLGQISLGPVFGLNDEQSAYAVELVYHGAKGAWMGQDDPLMPLMKALIADASQLSDVQQFCVLHAMLAKASGDWEAPILTSRSSSYAAAALASLRLDAPKGTVQAIDHVQIAIPKGGEEAAKPFYRDLLGLTEVPKPPAMAVRGGAWYENGPVKVHLGVEEPFHANDKAHVALIVDDVAAVAARAGVAGFVVKHNYDLSTHTRAFLYDPFGNRVEIMRAVDQSPFPTG
jgi:catechol 2,3-dioxygenase-like lactoylglutathione lyase family enzyme